MSKLPASREHTYVTGNLRGGSSEPTDSEWHECHLGGPTRDHTD